jgi:hypothetical protein
VNHLKKIPNLKVLSLSCCEKITDKSLAILGTMTKLECLDLTFCEKITNSGLSYISNLKLKKLVIANTKISSISNLKLQKDLILFDFYGVEQNTAIAREVSQLMPNLRGFTRREFFNT